MNKQSNWSPMQTLLFTALVPVAAVVGALVLFSLLRSQAASAPRAEATPSVSAGRSADDTRSAGREAFRDCLRTMGVDFGGSQFRGRFSPQPDPKKIQEAMSVCRSLLANSGAPPPAPRRSTAPPIA